MILSFYKKNHIWYIDLPDYIRSGGKEIDCAMVSGTDEILELFANKSNKVSFTVTINKIPESIEFELKKISKNNWGYYQSEAFPNKKFGLCPVSEWLFGEHPKKLFIKNSKRSQNN